MVNLNYDIKDIYEWPVKAQMILMALASVLILYFAYLLDVSSLRREIQSYQQQQETLKSQFKKLLDQQIKAENEFAKIPMFQQKLNEWEKSFITKSELTGLLDQILKLGSSDHIQFNFFEPGTEKKAGPFMAIPVKINATGTYSQLATFMSQLVNIPKLIEIGEFTITKQLLTGTGATSAPPGPDTPLVADMNINIYRK